MVLIKVFSGSILNAPAEMVSTVDVAATETISSPLSVLAHFEAPESHRKFPVKKKAITQSYTQAA